MFTIIIPSFLEMYFDNTIVFFYFYIGIAILFAFSPY